MIIKHSHNLLDGCEIRSFSENKQRNRPSGIKRGCSQFSERLLTVDTLPDLHDVCTEIRLFYGFDFFAIFTKFNRSELAPLCFLMREYENAWTQHYEKNRYMFVDPSIRMSCMRTSPYIWSSHLYDCLVDVLTPPELQVSRDALDFGLREVFNAPFKGVNGECGLVRFINIENGLSSRQDLKEQSRSMPELYLLSSHIFECLTRILCRRSSEDILSEREKDILTWTANGNSPAKISDTLHISENTVCNHLRNIRLKLQTRNTTHAVVKAISARIIRI